MDPKPGDKVLIQTADKQMEGVMMPSSHEDAIVIKLSTGYNVGILRKKVRTVKLLEKYKEPKAEKPKTVHANGRKTISILHTGGTIASKVDYNTGAVIARYAPEELVEMFPELEKLANISSRLISNMFSEDMRFQHYNIMAREIAKEIEAGADGIILTHGTDTLHYTAAALSFILEDLPVPVILVGAQRSSDRGSSDAAMNLLCAAEWIVQTDFAEVAICMHKSRSDDICWILPGLKCRKMHSSRRDAFKPINSMPYGEVDYIKRSIHVFEGSYRRREKRSLTLKPFSDVKVGMVYAHPHMFAEELKCYSKYDGLVLVGTGMGHWPINIVDKITGEHKNIFEVVTKIAKKIPVVMTTQTIAGRVDMNVYSTGRDLQKIGVIGNFSDMTPETTYIKLAWVLSNYPKYVKERMAENIRGEFSQRIR